MKPRFVIGLSVLALAAGVLALEKVSIGDLLKDASKYDGKDVTIQGVVEDLSEKVSGGGNAYTSLKVKDGEKRVTVWMRGHLNIKIKNGDEVAATGMFLKERKVGDVIYKNEIDMTSKPGKSYGLELIKAAD